MVYDKLVRDKIPEIIAARGGKPRTAVATGNEEYLRRLKEALEFSESGDAMELADVKEVLDAICRLMQITPERLAIMQARKVETHGRFERRIVLEEA